MAEEQDGAPQNPHEEEFSSDETAVEVVAPVNGVAPTKPRVTAPAGTQLKHAISWTEPAVNPRSDPLMNRINRAPVKDSERSKKDREFLEELMIKSCVNDYVMIIHRLLPSHNDSGDKIPTGKLPSDPLPVLSYDDLYDEVAKIWGGGQYRIAFADTAGRRVESIDRGILINIPTTTFPAKSVAYEKIESSPKSKGVTAPATDEFDAELKDLERQAKLAAIRKRILQAEELEQERAESEEVRKFERKKRRDEIFKNTMGAGEKSTELAMMEKRLDEEKAARIEAAKQAERAQEKADARAEATNKMFMDSLAKLAEKISDVANRPAPPPDNTLEKIITAMAPIAAALASRPPPQLPPPDTSNKELIIAMQNSQAQQQQSNTQLITALVSQPKADPVGPMNDLIMKMMTKENTLVNSIVANVMSKKDERGDLKVFMELMRLGEERTERMFTMMQGGAAPETSEPQNDYDPKLGFLGNAGKALFGGLKSLIEASATNPQVLEVVKALIGKRNPSDAEVAQVARRMEMQQGTVPPGMSYEPINQAYLPQGQPPMAQLQSPPQTGMPPAIRQPQRQPAAQPVASQVAAEFEGAASGLPGNGDPVEPTVEEYLSTEITEALRICVEEAAARANVRTWPQYALDHWNGDFLEGLSNLQTNAQRGPQIFSRCDVEVYKQLNDYLHANTIEIPEFWKGLDKLIDMYLKQKAQKIEAERLAQAAAAQVQAQPEQTPPAAQ